MDSSPLISVIVPVYKVEKYLDRCIQSIVDQTYTNLEIILVDDGSPDNCPMICDDWAAKDKRIKVIHKENGGLSDARNAGLEIAKGSIVSFVDSDDWIAPEMLERLIKSMRKDNSDIAACAVEMVWEDGRAGKLLTVCENRVLEPQEAQDALLQETLLKQPVWYKVYGRDTIRDIPFETGKYHEDVFWSYQAVGRAKRVSLIDYIGYYYTQRMGSIMSNEYSIKRLDAVEAYEKRCEYFEKRDVELGKKARIKLISSCIYNGQMALKYLPELEQRQAFDFLCAIIRKYPLKYKDYATIKLTHRIWLIFAEISLPAVCKMKNKLGIGT